MKICHSSHFLSLNSFNKITSNLHSSTIYIHQQFTFINNLHLPTSYIHQQFTFTTFPALRPLHAPAMTKRRKISNFLDVEAQVDSDEEEDLLEYGSGQSSDLEEGFLANEAEEAEAARQQSTLRAIHNLQKQQAELKEEDLSAEEERLKRLYGQERFSAADQDESTVPSQFLLPTPTDPKLWLVRCKPGKEREVAKLIQHKFLTAPKGGMLIQSVVARESLKGYIYVEALKQAHVIHAVQGVHNIYLSQKVALVPLAEMPHVLSRGSKGSSSKQSASFTSAVVGAWARVKRGKYLGDVGQVIELLDAGAERVRLRLIPKVLDKRMLFNPKEVSMLDKVNQITKVKGYWCYRNEEYNAKDGFLEKEFASSTLELGPSVFPSLEEMKIFAGASNEATASAVSAPTSIGQTKAPVQFFAGDRVVVCGSGEHQGSKAIVQEPANDQGILTVKMQDSALKVRLSRVEVKKSFQLGDHVQVCNGIHKGESGMIVALDDDRYATFFCDTSVTQLQVFVNDLTLASNATNSTVMITPQSAGNNNSNNNNATVQSSEHLQVAVGDFVQWNSSNAGQAASNFGIVIRWLGGSKICVLDGNSHQVQISPSQLISPSGKRTFSSATALDAQSRLINVGDLAEVLDGPHSKTQATVTWIHRGVCFLKSKQHGILAVQASNLLNLSFKGHSSHSLVTDRSGKNGLSSMNFLARNLPTDWELRGKSVMIVKGAFKGYLGVARELIGPTNVSVELHTASKTVTVRREDVQLVAGQQSHQPAKGGREGYAGRRNERQFTTTTTSSSSQGSQGNYFAASGATAGAASGKTPTWDGGKTPTWDGGKTPTWDGGAGSKTPVWGGGKTPSWAGGKTPVWGESGAGGRTPVWGNAPEKASDWKSNASSINDWNSSTSKSDTSSNWNSSTDNADTSSNWNSSTSTHWNSTHSSTSTASPAKDKRANSMRPTRTAFGTEQQPVRTNEPPPPPSQSSSATETINWGSMKSQSSAASSCWIKKGFWVKATSGIHSEKHFIVSSTPSAADASTVQCKDLEDESFFLDAQILEPVRPARRDAVHVLSGAAEDVNREGVLVSLDGQECIVKMNDGDEMKVLALDQLVKLHQ